MRKNQILMLAAFAGLVALAQKKPPVVGARKLPRVRPEQLRVNASQVARAS